METIGPLQLKFLINSDEVRADSERVKKEITGIGQTAESEAEKAEKRVREIIARTGKEVAGQLKFGERGFVPHGLEQAVQKTDELRKSTSAAGKEAAKAADAFGKIGTESGVEQAVQKVDELKDSTGAAAAEASAAGTVYKKLGAAVAGYFSIQAIVGFTKQMAAVRGEFQQLEISLETILGSKERADRVLAQAVELAAKTPFDLSGVGDATKQLLAYGFEAENVVEEIRRLGDVSAGLNIPLSDMAYLYGTTRVQGRLFAQDLMQFTNRGIPLIGQLASQFGVAEDEVKNLVSAGKVGFPEVEKAMHALTNEGGMFFNLMEKQSASIPGQLANLGDAWEMALNDMGRSSEGFMSSGIAGVTVLVENYQTVIDIVKVLAVSYGSYRAALMLTSVATRAMTAANAGMTASQILLARWTAIADRAQRILNATMLANPYVAAATALAALISAIVIFNKNSEKAETSQSRLKTAMEGVESSVKDQETEVRNLISTLQDQNIAESVRLKSYNELKRISPDIVEGLTFEEAKTKDLTQSVYDYIDALSQRLKAEQLTQESLNLSKERIEAEERLIAAQERVNSMKGSDRVALTPYGMSNAQLAEDSLGRIQKQLNDIVAAEKAVNEQLASGFDQSNDSIQKRIAHLTNLKGMVDETSEAYKQYEDEIIRLEATLKKSTSVQEEISYLKDLKEQLKELQDTRENQISITDTDALAENERQQLELQQKIAALEIKAVRERAETAKKTELETLKASIDDKRKAYEDYYAAIDILGKESADEQFAALRKEGETYIEWLKKAQAGLDPKSPQAGRQQVMITQEIRRAEGTLSPLEQLKTELEEMKRVYADFETYKKQFGIQAAKEQFSGQMGEFESYLDFVRAKTIENQGAFTAVLEGRSTDGHRETAKLLEKEADEAGRAEKQRHNERLAELQSYETRKTKMIQDYEAERRELLSGGDMEEAAELERRHNKELAELKKANSEKTAEYERYLQGIEAMGARSARELLKSLRSTLETEFRGGKIDEAEYNRILKLLMQAEMVVSDRLPNAMRSIAGSVGDMAQSLGKSNEGFSKLLATAGQVIGRLADMRQGINDFNAARQAGDSLGTVTAGAGVAGAAVGIVTTIANVIKAGQERQIALMKEQLELQRQIFLGEIDINQLHRDRALAAAESGRNTIESLKEQRRILEENLRGIQADISSIEGVFGRDLSDAVMDGLVNNYRKQESYLRELGQHLYDTGETKMERGYGLFGLGKREVKVFETLAGLTFENIEELSLRGQLTEEAEELFQKLKELKEEGLEVERQFGDIQDRLKGIFTADLEWSGMADGIIAEFQGAGSHIEEILRNAILNGFKYRFLEGPLNELIDQFAEDAQSGGELTNAEIDKFTRAYEALSENAQKALDKLEKSTGISLSGDAGKQPTQGLSSAIRRDITEETGSELTGLTRAQYDIHKRGLELNEQRFELERRHYDGTISIMQSNALIERNTAQTVTELKAAVAELKGINLNTKPSNNMRAYTS